MTFNFSKSVLLRKSLRSDVIWDNPLFARWPFWKIPLYLDTQILLKSEYWSREEIKELGLKRFAETVRYASKIPFWKERFEKAGIDPMTFRESDIARIPLLSKKDFLDKKETDYTIPELITKSRIHGTSGSTGKPFKVYHDQQLELRSSAVSERMFRNAGDGKRFPIVVIKSIPQHGFDYIKYSFFFLRSFNNVRHRIRALQNLLSFFQDRVIFFILASSLVELVHVCQELNIVLRPYSIITFGEGLSDFQQKEIEKFFNTSIRSMYGMTELHRLAFECAQHRFHLSEESVYFEIVDDHGTPLPSGENGHLIVTGFDNHVMPFIRYETGDVGVIRENPCSCGRTSRTIEFHGRKVELLDVGDGRTVSLISLFSIFDGLYDLVRQFQVIRIKKCSFIVYIVPGIHFEKRWTEKMLIELFRFHIHPQAQVEWEIVDFIPEGSSGKARYFIDEFKENHE